jgi:hypothetical protein
MYASTLLVQGCMRLGGLCIYIEEVSTVPIRVILILVNRAESDVIKIRGGGVALPCLRQRVCSFWESLHYCRGIWMWDYVSDATTDPDWLPGALKQGTAILATDGSYAHKRGPKVSGAGGVIACRRSGRMLKGSFFEFSSNSSSYREEVLGMVAIHTLVWHACQFYQPSTISRKFICDKELALYKSSRRGHRRICPGTAQADLFWTLRSIHQEMLGANLRYEQVKSHQNSLLPWHLLTFEEQLNTTCNTLANEVVTCALGGTTLHKGPSLLPFKSSMVLINNVKIASNVALAIRFLLNRVEASGEGPLDGPSSSEMWVAAPAATIGHATVKERGNVQTIAPAG